MQACAQGGLAVVAAAQGSWSPGQRSRAGRLKIGAEARPTRISLHFKPGAPLDLLKDLIRLEALQGAREKV